MSFLAAATAVDMVGSALRGLNEKRKAKEQSKLDQKKTEVDTHLAKAQDAADKAYTQTTHFVSTAKTKKARLAGLNAVAGARKGSEHIQNVTRQAQQDYEKATHKVQNSFKLF